MNAPAKQSEATTVAAQHSLIVYGRDADRKARSAVFPPAHADFARKEGLSNKLTSIEAATDDLLKIAGDLPVGKVEDGGKVTFPTVAVALYDKLMKAVTAARAGEAGGTPVGVPHRPKSWSEIGVGSLVLIEEELGEEGYFVAIVTEANGDKLTLRWHGYPTMPVIHRTRDKVALLFPG